MDSEVHDMSEDELNGLDDEDFNESLNEETKLSSDGRQRPTSYKKRVSRKPLNVQVYDDLVDLNYDVYAGRRGYAYDISKKFEKNLQRAKDYLDSMNVGYTVRPFQGRYHLMVSLPEESDNEINNYFKTAVNESFDKRMKKINKKTK
ncbi:hypothetical protein [uncultured Clostridium sp.]|uniref:hypothetical protein n=1 Tax=uncultured Clostridium sp. TaxID=59620 RepID=UPI0026337340|nr:hypothetical protein [uncultured Clostridium sp.]